MIEILFSLGSDYVLVKIQGSQVLFGNTYFGAKMATIDGLRLDKKGVIKEFPDLKDNILWKEEAVKRFKHKIKTLATEHKRAEYIIQELAKHGYKPIKKQVNGRRPEKIEWD